MTTDYTPGDPPLPLGTIVLYSYDEGAPERAYEVAQHLDPKEHPHPPPEPPLDEAYPDGVGYLLWPVGVPKKFGRGSDAVSWVRRTSLRIEESEKQ